MTICGNSSRAPRRIAQGDRLAGVAAESGEERVAAQMALADLPLAGFLDEAVVPYEDGRGDAADHRQPRRGRLCATVSHLTVGDFRDWLLSDEATARRSPRLAPGLTPEMAAAVSKLMRNQDLIAVGDANAGW